MVNLNPISYPILPTTSSEYDRPQVQPEPVQEQGYSFIGAQSIPVVVTYPQQAPTK